MIAWRLVLSEQAERCLWQAERSTSLIRSAIRPKTSRNSNPSAHRLNVLFGSFSRFNNTLIATPRLLEGQFILVLPLTIDSLTTDPK
jgi:hypothetical protein